MQNIIIVFQAMSAFEMTASIGSDLEFHSLKLVDDMHVFTTNEGKKLENLDKNRYRNIFPCKYPKVAI